MYRLEFDKTFIRPNYDNSIKLLDIEKYFPVKEIVFHLNPHGYIDYDYDICLIQLTKPIQFDDSIGPINLPDEQYEPGIDLVTMGFGEIDRLTPTLELKKITLTLRSDDYCDQRINDFLPTLTICAGIEALGGACLGDGGGPLVHIENDRHILVGIISSGFECGSRIKPNVFVNVFHFVDWIKEQSENLIDQKHYH